MGYNFRVFETVKSKSENTALIPITPGRYLICTDTSDVYYDTKDNVQKAIREKNWSKVLNMVMNLMQTAETKFETGAERKEWVLAMVKASADTIDYDIDMDAISDLIDSLCNMSKVVNAPKA